MSDAFDSEVFDIVIAGAGLVGASMACTLASDSATRTLRIALIEPGEIPQSFVGDEFDPRVVALTRNSEQFFSRLGVWPAIVQQRACAYQKMLVWDGEGNAKIEFDAAELHERNLGYIVENSVVLNALLKAIEKFPNIKLLRGQSVQSVQPPQSVQQSGSAPHSPDARVHIGLSDGTQLNCSLLIAADGAHSPVREQLGFAIREWDYGHSAIVATVHCELPHQYTAWQRFMHTGPLAFLPLQNGDDAHACSIVWSATEVKAEALMALNDADFAAALAQGFEFTLGQIESVSKRYCFPLRQRHAIDYVKPGLVLVGDAAHTIHPLAGQGVNLGLQDVQALHTEIQRAMTRQIPLSDFSILRRYQRARKPANLAMMTLMESFKRLFGSEHPALLVARNFGMRQVDRLPFLKNAIAKQAMGLR